MVYAHEVNYFKTSKTQPDTWIERAKKEIRNIGGVIVSEVYGMQDGQAAFQLRFRIADEEYLINWRVLPIIYKTDERAAVIQAATLLYHDVKHKVVMAKVKGVRRAFLEYLLLPNGVPAGEIASSERHNLLPQILELPANTGE